MATSVLLLRVFVASPADVFEERERLALVLAELNRTVAAQAGARLELTRWETDARPGFGADAQDVINRQLCPADIFIGVMWRRFGTPTHRAESGTAEEFELAYHSWSTNGTPSMMMYFRDRGEASASGSTREQLAKVTTFHERIATLGGLSWTYSDVAHFERLVREHVTKELPAVIQRLTGSVSPHLPSALSDQEAVIGSLCNDFIPAMRHLVRVTDDLRTSSDHYLATPPSSLAAAREQTNDMRNAIQAYNDGWERVYQQRLDFEQIVDALDRPLLHELRKRATSMLLSAIDFPRGYDSPPGEPSRRSFRPQHQAMARRWREQRTLLQPKLERARAELDELEAIVQRMATEQDMRDSKEDARDALWETAGLLADYRMQCHGHAQSIRAFVDSDFSIAEEVARNAWAMAPWIEGVNAAYIAIENRSMALTWSLLRHANRDGRYRQLSQTLARSRTYQWQEVRPVLNALIANIVALVHGDTSDSLLRAIQQQTGEWTRLTEILEKRGIQFDVSGLVRDMVG